MSLDAVNKDDVYYTSKEVADLLRVSRSTLLRMSKRGDLPAPIRLSRSTMRWSKKMIDALLEMEQVNAKTPINPAALPGSRGS